MISSIIITVILIASISLFLALFKAVNKKDRKKKQIKRRVSFASHIYKHKLEITHREEINDLIIAIDKINFMLLIQDFSLSNKPAHLIDLWKISDIRISKKVVNEYGTKKISRSISDSFIEKISIEIFLNGTDAPNHSFYLYDLNKPGIHDLHAAFRKGNETRKLLLDTICELPVSLSKNA